MQLEKCVEFVVSLPNRPGTFAQLSQRLTANQVRIRVFMLYTSYVLNVPDNPVVAGMCKLVVDEDERARKTLRELGFGFREEKGLLLRTPKQADILPIILEKLAAADLNLVDAYGVLPLDGEDLLIVLSVSDEEKGFELASQLDWRIPQL